jgi:hypothetical protein
MQRRSILLTTLFFDVSFTIYPPFLLASCHSNTMFYQTPFLGGLKISHRLNRNAKVSCGSGSGICFKHFHEFSKITFLCNILFLYPYILPNLKGKSSTKISMRCTRLSLFYTQQFNSSYIHQITYIGHTRHITDISGQEISHSSSHHTLNKQHHQR